MGNGLLSGAYTRDAAKTAEMNELLMFCVNNKASDLHLAVGAPPAYRVNGLLTLMKDKQKLTPADTERLCLSMLSEDQLRQFAEDGEIDFSYGLERVGRFRCNIFRQRGTLGGAFRTISPNIKSIDELGLPPVVKSLATKTRGLVLVTGPTGSGKSTSLAAIIDYINETRSTHILTLEDPIEYLHKHKMSIVHQREIGFDSKSFAAALRAALREDPDVILLGEMRDLETTAIAISAAETGHLVFATLHTVDAVQAVDRIIDMYPPYQQQQIRVQLAAVLEAVVAQRLLRTKDGNERVAAFEVLIGTQAVRNLIREGKTHQIFSHIQTGSRFGMQTMDSTLTDLVNKGIVTGEEAVLYASSAEALKAGSGGSLSQTNGASWI